MAKPFLLSPSFKLYFNQRIYMYGYKVKCLLMGELLKMRYCLWKSIKNHHISTTDKLLFKYVVNKTTKCNYTKMLAFPIMMRYSYNVIQ